MTHADIDRLAARLSDFPALRGNEGEERRVAELIRLAHVGLTVQSGDCVAQVTIATRQAGEQSCPATVTLTAPGGGQIDISCRLPVRRLQPTIYPLDDND